MRRGLAAAAVVAAGALVAACGSSPAHPAPSAVGPADEITAATVGSLGTVLVDGQGYTLYAYAPDAHGGRSRCTGVCPAVWPPVTLAPGTAAPIAGPGVDRALFATTIRPGGGVQVTYGGWPLYRWTGDSAPGAHTGQDIFNAGGYWYVVRPDGHVVR